MIKKSKCLGIFILSIFLVTSCVEKTGNKEVNKEIGKIVVMGCIPAPDFQLNKEHINWSNLTHVNLQTLYVHSDATLDTDIISPMLNECIKSAHDKNIKVIVSLKNDENNMFKIILKSPIMRQSLINNLLCYIDSTNIDGIDLNCEMNNEFCPEILSFASEFAKLKGEETLLTCAVSPWNASNGNGYSKEWQKYFDYINIMSYDNTGKWSYEGQHASYEQSQDAIRLWNETLQTPYSKLILGIPFYGYSWDHIPNLDSTGVISYADILKTYKKKGIENADVVGRTYYNGKGTIIRKCKIVKQNGLAGVMIWNLFQDCNSIDSSLIEVIGNELLTKY